jgi:hypothetical protein
MYGNFTFITTGISDDYFFIFSEENYSKVLLYRLRIESMKYILQQEVKKKS